MQASGARTLVIGGGVAANKTLARTLRSALARQGVAAHLIVPPMAYCQDNAAMIALAGYVRFAHHVKKLPCVANGILSLP